MDAKTIFYIIIGILIIDFVVDKVLDYLNALRFDDPIPEALHDVYDKKAYRKSQAYKKTRYNFSLVTSWFYFIITLCFFFLDGFQYIDTMARSISKNNTVIAILFLGIIIMASNILMVPFSYYKTFVIEEKFGFNTTTKRLFFIDKIKGWLLMMGIGGGILGVISWCYQLVGVNFWWYVWALVLGITIFMNLYYSTVIVPLFNTQRPLEEGSLKTSIEDYASKTGFSLAKIFVIDGSKRSTKANAYFSGFGSQKRVILYDTLISDLEDDEIVAVLAHEVGHYKHKHVIFNSIFSFISTGITLFILSLFITIPELSMAIGVKQPSFHAGLIAFGILYGPISRGIGLMMNSFSRAFEYQADAFARTTYNAGFLISALKKLSRNHLSNLTPHPVYVFMYYSHPTLLQRIQKLKA